MASESIYAPKPSAQPVLGNDGRGSSSSSSNEDEDSTPPPNPYLTKAKLFILDVDASLSDRDLANSVFQPFVPVRLNIDRTKSSSENKFRGTVEFQTLEKAEQAYATIVDPQLSIKEDGADETPSAKPRLIKELPPNTEDVDVYDIFRSYGPIASARRILTNPQGQVTGFRGMAVVHFYDEGDAQRAQDELHCAEVEGKTISVSIDPILKRPAAPTAQFSASATPFVPGQLTSSSSSSQHMSATAPVFEPPQRAMPVLQQQGGPTMSVPGSNLQYSASAATYIDPCNLFCKNLDPTIDSEYLDRTFREFGQIVSARVMRDDKGVSREFGFVSFRRPEDASRALQAMHQTMHGSKQMFVRLHEPKKVRQEKLSQKFGTAYLAGGAVGFDTPSDGVTYSDGSQSPPMRRDSQIADFQGDMVSEADRAEIERLQGMSSSSRKEYVKSKFREKLATLVDVDAEKVDELVGDLCKLTLADAVIAINDPAQLSRRVREIQSKSQSGLSPGMLSDAVMSPSLSAGSEKERLQQAVVALLPVDSPVEDIVDLLVELPKKERAMSLFNQEFLRRKVEEAMAILEMGEEDEKDQKAAMTGKPAPLTEENIARATAGRENTGNGLAAAKEVAGGVSKRYTLAELAALPAIDIVKLANATEDRAFPLPKADPAVVKETDEFIDGIKNLSPTDQKQKLGDQLFKKIRTFGVKGAPKITIALLDGEDLRALAHLMNSYTDCLHEKVLLLKTSK